VYLEGYGFYSSAFGNYNAYDGYLSIWLPNEGWEIVDTGSKNGTLVNGQPVHRHKLRDGDLIEAGHTLFLFRAALEAGESVKLAFISAADGDDRGEFRRGRIAPRRSDGSGALDASLEWRLAEQPSREDEAAGYDDGPQSASA
jgi:hypothetical protein